MPTDGAVNLYKIQSAVKGLYSLTGTPYAKGYSGQRISENLKELVSLLDTRISVSLVENGDWNPEENPTRPTVTEDGIRYPETETETKGGGETETNRQPNPADEANNHRVLVIMLIVLGAAIAVAAVTGVVMFRLAGSKKKVDRE